MASLYIPVLTALLLLSSAWHLVAPAQTERWMSRPNTVRVVGLILLVLAIPSLFWRGWFFRILFLALAVSGLWRLCLPQHSIHAQQRTYPRWVHGCLLLAAAVLVWVLHP